MTAVKLGITLWIGGEKLRCKLTRLTFNRDDCGIDSSERSTYKLTRAKGFRKLPTADVLAALDERFYEGCACVHDCCGCWVGGVRSIKKVRGHVIFTVGYARNV